MSYFRERTAPTIDGTFNDILFSELLKRHGLFDMWQHIRSTNTGTSNPYHNNRHMWNMAQIALTLFRTTFVSAPPLEKYLWVEKELLIACLWHDYEHSGGRLPDAENIERAVSGMYEWAAEHGQHIIPEILAEAGEAIRVTEFPFIHTPKDIVQWCIRDADLLYTFSNNTGPIVEGLYEEIKHKLNGATFQEFLLGQRKFLATAEFFTTEGRLLRDALIDRVVDTQVVYGQSLLDAQS